MGKNRVVSRATQIVARALYNKQQCETKRILRFSVKCTVSHKQNMVILSKTLNSINVNGILCFCGGRELLDKYGMSIKDSFITIPVNFCNRLLFYLQLLVYWYKSTLWVRAPSDFAHWFSTLSESPLSVTCQSDDWFGQDSIYVK